MNNFTASSDNDVYIDDLYKSISVDEVSNTISMLKCYKSCDCEIM
jgi:hypothetical protein